MEYFILLIVLLLLIANTTSFRFVEFAPVITLALITLISHKIIQHNYNERYEQAAKEKKMEYEKILEEFKKAKSWNEKNILNLSKKIVELENKKYKEKHEYSVFHAFFDANKDYLKEKVLYGSAEDEFNFNYEVKVEKKKCLENANQGFFLSTKYKKYFYDPSFDYFSFNVDMFGFFSQHFTIIANKIIDSNLILENCITYDSCKDKEPHFSNICKDPDKNKFKLTPEGIELSH